MKVAGARVSVPLYYDGTGPDFGHVRLSAARAAVVIARPRGDGQPVIVMPDLPRGDFRLRHCGIPPWTLAARRMVGAGAQRRTDSQSSQRIAADG